RDGDDAEELQVPEHGCATIVRVPVPRRTHAAKLVRDSGLSSCTGTGTGTCTGTQTGLVVLRTPVSASRGRWGVLAACGAGCVLFRGGLPLHPARRLFARLPEARALLGIDLRAPIGVVQRVGEEHPDEQER